MQNSQPASILHCPRHRGFVVDADADCVGVVARMLLAVALAVTFFSIRWNKIRLRLIVCVFHLPNLRPLKRTIQFVILTAIAKMGRRDG